MSPAELKRVRSRAQRAAMGRLRLEFPTEWALLYAAHREADPDTHRAIVLNRARRDLCRRHRGRFAALYEAEKRARGIDLRETVTPAR